MLFFLVLKLVRSDYFDDFSYDYDEDLEEPAPVPTPQKETLPQMPQQPDYTLEILVLGLIVLYIANLFVGKQKNEKIATDWLYMLKPLFQENFYHTGAAEKEGEGEMM